MRWRMKRTEERTVLWMDGCGLGGGGIYFYSFFDWSAFGTDTVDLERALRM
jgi:hypothetical protein